MPSEKKSIEKAEEPELLDLDAHMANTSTESPQASNSPQDSQSSGSEMDAGTVPVFDELHTSDSGSTSETEEAAPVPVFDELFNEGDESSSTNRPQNKVEDNDPQIKQRRERNRKAALECRKRQMDKTKSLEEQVATLRQEESRLQAQIRQQREDITKMKLNFGKHIPRCRLKQQYIQANLRKRQAAAAAAFRRQASGTFVPAL